MTVADSFGRVVLRVGRSQGVAGVLRLALPIVLARLLVPAEFGVFSILTVLTLLAFNLGNLGLPASITYHVARASDGPRVAVYNSLLMALVYGSLAALVATTVVLALGERIVGDAETVAVVCALAAVPAYFLCHASLSVFLGLGDFRRYNGLSVGLHLALLVGSLAGWAIDRSGTGAVVGWAVGSLLVASTAVLRVRPAWRPAAHLDLAFWKTATAYGAKSHLAGLLTFLNYRLDVLFVATLLGTREAGLYAAAVALAETVWFFSQVAGGVLFARIASGEGDAGRLELTTLTSRLVFLASGLAALALALLAEPLLAVVYAESYGSAATTLRVALIGIVALSVSRVLAQFVAGIGQPERNIAGSLLGLVANIALNLALIPILGIVGAALASAVSYTLTLGHRLWLLGRFEPAGHPLVECLVPRRGDLRIAWTSLRRR